MKFSELKTTRHSDRAARLRFVLPDGDRTPGHFLIPEVDYVAKRFVGCGGTLHDTGETCLLQTSVADNAGHRLDAGTFVEILEVRRQVLPHDDLEVAVEYDCCVEAQYPIAAAKAIGEAIEIQLSEKHADCLAEEKRGLDRDCCSPAEKVEVLSTGCCC